MLLFHPSDTWISKLSSSRAARALLLSMLALTPPSEGLWAVPGGNKEVRLCSNDKRVSKLCAEVMVLSNVCFSLHVDVISWLILICIGVMGSAPTWEGEREPCCVQQLLGSSEFTC